MIVTIVVVVAAAIAVVLVLAAFKPETFLIQRTATVKAAPGKVFPWVSDFHNWAAWSPFEKLDPNMTKTFSGAASGKGAIYEWKGNRKAGEGRMETVESSIPNNITIKLDFLKPLEGHYICEFTMSPKGDSTEITWAMHGPLPFMARVTHVFVNMDRMLGKDFEAGLASLKALAET